MPGLRIAAVAFGLGGEALMMPILILLFGVPSKGIGIPTGARLSVSTGAAI